jgi:hypothetical protein
MKRREQTKPNALDEDQNEVQQIEGDDGDHDVLHPNVKFTILKEQAIFCSDIPDDDPIYAGQDTRARRAGLGEKEHLS